MTGRPRSAERGPDGQAGDAMGDEPAALPDDPERDEEEVDVLYLAGQRLAGHAEWLLITAVDAKPGGEFLAAILPADGPVAHGGDVLVRLTEQIRHHEPLKVGVSAWAVMCGLLILVADWAGLGTSTALRARDGDQRRQDVRAVVRAAHLHPPG